MTAQLSAPDTHLYPTRSHPGILSLLPTRPNPNETKLGFSATPTPLRQLHRTGDQPETFAPLPPSPSLLRRSVPVPRHRARSPRLRGPGPAPLRSSPPRSAEGSSNGTAGAPGGPGPVTPHSAIVGGLGEEQGGGGASRIRPLRGRRNSQTPHDQAAGLGAGAGRAPPAPAPHEGTGRPRAGDAAAAPKAARPGRGAHSGGRGPGLPAARGPGPRRSPNPIIPGPGRGSSSAMARPRPGSYLRRGQMRSWFGRPGPGGGGSRFRRWLR